MSGIPTLTFHATITGTQSITAAGGPVTVGAESQNEAITFQNEQFVHGVPHALQAIQFQASDLFSNLSLPAGSTEMNSLTETLDVSIPTNLAHFWF
jgi:hypothetical protein